MTQLKVLSPRDFQDRLSKKLTSNRKKNKENRMENPENIKDLQNQLYNSISDYPDNLDTVIVPEPTGTEFLKRILRSESNRVELLAKELQEFQTLKYEDLNKKENHINKDTVFNDSGFPASNYWFNTTEKGINLRPGVPIINGEPLNRPDVPIILGQDGVHGLVGGVTGSGKSVFLNNLISNMMMEYPAWELDMYLIDFKKIEFSMYLSNKELQAPHVNVVGATEEMDYVLSIFRYLRACLNDREKLFQALDGQSIETGLTNIKNISDFRAFGRKIIKKNIVLPRILLIIDEFQQLFLNSSTRMQNEISKTIEVLTKKGRALGIHLLFSSQDLSNTLDSSTMSNFGIRFALPMNGDRSESLIESPEAEKLNIGQVIAYCSRENDDSKRYRKFQVPFQKGDEDNSEEGSMLNNLKVQKKLEIESGFSKDKVYYQEDMMKDFKVIKNVQQECADQIETLLNEHQFNNYLLLGPSTVYNSIENDFLEVFTEKKKNCGFALIGDSIEKLGYLLYLTLYNILSNGPERIVSIFEADKKVTSTLGKQLTSLLAPFKHLFLDKQNVSEMVEHYENNKMNEEFYEARSNRLQILIGLENMDLSVSEMRSLQEYISESTRYGSVWIIVSEPTDNYNVNDILKDSCDYQFLYVNNEENFRKYDFDYTERALDSIRIEFKIKHKYKQQGFKMLNLPDLEEYIEPRIDIPRHIFE